MANKEQLKILKQGVEEWNEWRREHPDESPDLEDADLRNATLRGTHLGGATLWRADLAGTNLHKAKLYHTDLVKTNLRCATITGAYLYDTARDNWVIDGIICDYVFWDLHGTQRTPKDRDFRPGEFEELYKYLPTIGYYFEHSFTPLDPIIINQIVQAIDEKHPEYKLRIDSFHSRG